jgi:tetratricopeptide (TPR) repeat protein
VHDVGEEEVPLGRRAVTILAVVFGVVALMIGALVLRATFMPPEGTPAPPSPGPDSGSTHDRALRELAAARTRLGDGRDTEAAFQLAVGFARQYPDDVEGHLVAARGAYARLDFDAAAAHAGRACTVDGSASPAWRVMGFVAMERGQTRAAAEAFAKGTSSFSCRLPPHAEDESDVLIASALAAYLRNDRPGAERILADADRRRRTAEGCRWMGAIQTEPGANSRWQTSALQVRSDYAPARLERGRANAALGAHELAVEDFDAALAVLARSYELLLLRALSLAALGRLEAAEEAFGQAIEAGRRELRPWLERAIVRRARGRWAEALEDATQVTKIDPTLAAGHMERGRALWKLGRRQEADDAFALALSRDPRVKGEIEKIKRE